MVEWLLTKLDFGKRRKHLKFKVFGQYSRIGIEEGMPWFRSMMIGSRTTIAGIINGIVKLFSSVD